MLRNQLFKGRCEPRYWFRSLGGGNMRLFDKFFGKKKDDDNFVRIRSILEKFIEATFLTLNDADKKDSSQGMTILLYMFGAVDMLCQFKGMDENTTLILFNEMLKNELGEYTDEQAQALLTEVIRVSAQTEGQQLMKEGGEALRSWLVKSDPRAAFRLTEILMAKDK